MSVLKWIFTFPTLCAVLNASNLVTVKETVGVFILYVHSAERMITNMKIVKVTPQNVPIALVLMLHTPKNAQGGRLSMRSRKSKHIQVSHSPKHAECCLESIVLMMVNLRITMLLLHQKHHIGKR